MRLTKGCRKAYLLLLFCLPAAFVIAQSEQQSGQYISTVDGKMVRFSNDAEHYTLNTLNTMIGEEKRMQDKMAAHDPIASRKLFGYAIDSLQRLKTAISGTTAKTNRLLSSNYFPYSDSLRQSLAFLQNTAAGKGAAISGRLTSSMQQVNVLEGKLNTIAVIQTYIRQRQQVLTNAIGSLPQYTANLQQLNKTAYYYSAQIAAYKATLKDPAPIEQKMLGVLNNSPAFADLLQRNGQLAGLFVPRSMFINPPLSGNPVNGLPTRLQLQQYLRQHVSTQGDTTDPVEQLKKKFIAAGTQLQENGASAGTGAPAGLNMGSLPVAGIPTGGEVSTGGTASSPGFTPNSQKTKSFGHRLQWGVDLQFGQAVSYLPSTTDFGVSVGYKLNDKTSAGVGVDYLMGMGTGWKDIHLSNQGVGLRSYGKWQIKKGWDLQGGMEANYMTSFSTISQLRGLQQWQTSALLGISKQYRVSHKINGNFQVLYDFLYKQHSPTTQPVLFRLGYDLN